MEAGESRLFAYRCRLESELSERRLDAKSAVPQLRHCFHHQVNARAPAASGQGMHRALAPEHNPARECAGGSDAEHNPAPPDPMLLPVHSLDRWEHFHTFFAPTGPGFGPLGAVIYFCTMNKKQIAQTIIGVGALVLIIIWLFTPVKLSHKILGIIANALLFTSMLLSHIAEEKNKNNRV